MQVLTNSEQITNWKSTLKGKLSYVPTMGALHEGHFELIRKAKEQADYVIVSIFVNPLQFNNSEDLAKYPRTDEQDKQALISLGVDALFFPSEAVMYPEGLVLPQFELGLLDQVLEGAHRPGHFQGVAKVVYRLFDLIQPDAAVFGEKDLQQVAVIRCMLEQSKQSVRLSVIPTVRATSGLALSSRNVRLSQKGIITAEGIYRVLLKAKNNVQKQDFDQLELVSQLVLESEGFDVEYVKCVNGFTFEKPTGQKDETISMCVAASLEGVRLIDNMQLIP